MGSPPLPHIHTVGSFMNKIPHQKSLLLVEDLEEFYGPISRWLEEEGYQVTLASSLTAALTCLETGHYYLAIIDIRTKDDDPQNQDGMKLLEEIEKRGFNEVMPCIVLTAHANVEIILKATQVRHVARFIEKKAGYRTELLTAVRTQFNETIDINFDLIYDLDAEQLIPQIAADINWEKPPKPAAAVLVPQVYDLFGKLFARARRLYVAKLKPGLTGAAVVFAQPTWLYGMGPAYVVKIGRREKVALEGQRYDDFVKPYLPPNTTTQVDVAFTPHLGALQYSFAESDFRPLKEFDEFYKGRSSEEIISSLQNLFQNTGHWYNNSERRFADIPQLYYDAFQLDETKLHGRIQEILPDFSPDQLFLRFPGSDSKVINPIAWLAEHRHESVMAIYHCITHGDLTGRNIMVNEQGRCWLIDFYRTHESHILRDFVILETDIMYRLLPASEDKTLIRLEQMVLDTNFTETRSQFAVDLPPVFQKAAHVILALRGIAYEFLRDRGGVRQDTHIEYLFSLLMATLNVVRLRHISENRKLLAMLSAALICSKLDDLAGRKPLYDNGVEFHSILPEQLTAYKRLTPSANLTIPQRHLIDQFKRSNLILFIGTATPTDSEWPSLVEIAHELVAEIGYEPEKNLDPRQMFSIYDDERGNRTKLIDKIERYFKRYSPPSLFRKIATLNWPAIYTTNQHTLLEDAFIEIQNSCEVIASLPLQPIGKVDVVSIYKLYGSLGKEFQREKLPLTSHDYQDPDIGMEKRKDEFLSELKRELNKGRFLLVFYPSEEELDLVHDLSQSLRNGAIWFISSDLPIYEQDYHRSFGLRVLPDDPQKLLSVFMESSND